MADQIVRFLMRHQWRWHLMNDGEDSERKWAQLAYQEPDSSLLSQGITRMRWVWKGRLIHQRTGKGGYHNCIMGVFPRDTDTGHDVKHCKAICASPDGKMLALSADASQRKSGEKYTVDVYDLASGDLLREMPVHTRKICCLAWSSDSRLLASGGEDKTIQITNESGGVVCALQGHTDEIACVAWMPDGSLIIRLSLPSFRTR